MTVHLLSGEAYTPEICLRDALNGAKEVENIIILTHYKDGTSQTLMSHMHISRACYLAKVLDRRILTLIEQMSCGR